MNKKGLIILGIVIILVVVAGVVGYKKGISTNTPNENVSKTENITNSEKVEKSENVIDVEELDDENEVEVAKTTTKKEQKGTAGSNIPLKDNEEEAKYQIEVAMQKLFEEMYGSDVFDARIYVQKIYTAEEEQDFDPLKQMELGPDEVAFEVKYELKPSPDADINKLTVATGEYDEESGWIIEKYNVGVLRPDGDGYKITDFGTGF